MDREKFDRWLVSIIPADVEKKFNAIFKSFAKIPGGYEIRYSCSGQEISAKTKVIVGADGAFSRIRKSIPEDTDIPEKYISIQEWFENTDYMPYYTAIFDEEISDFYSWMIPKGDYLLVGAALRPRDNTRDKYNLLKTKLTKLGITLNNRLKTEGAYINRPTKVSQLFVGRDGIALVGEAAGAISPSSAEGFSYALKSSLYLSQSLEEGIDGFLDRYNQRVKDMRQNILLKNVKSPVMYNPFLRKLALKSGLQCIR